MSILNILRGIWSFILSSLRIILFLALLIILLAYVLTALMLIFQGDHIESLQFPNSKERAGVLIESLLYIGVILVGCHGSFYNNHKSLKLFAIATSLYTIYSIIGISLMEGPSRFSPANRKFAEDMIKSQAIYSWDHIYANEESKIATKRWDSLQMLGCCGMDDPNEWISLLSSKYPPSCCRFGYGWSKACTASEIYKIPCSKVIEGIQYYSMAVGYAFIGLLIILTLMACIIINMDLERVPSLGTASYCQPATGTTVNILGPAGQEYSRFDNSVYIRQPPINLDHKESSVAQKSQALYPNVNDGDQNNSNQATPPPKYNLAIQ